MYFIIELNFLNYDVYKYFVNILKSVILKDVYFHT